MLSGRLKLGAAVSGNDAAQGKADKDKFVRQAEGVNKFEGEGS